MKLYRSFATVGGLTMVSRILGFVRDILIAAGLGTGLVADAYFVAFRFPNLFRQAVRRRGVQLRLRAAVCETPGRRGQ